MISGLFALTQNDFRLQWRYRIIAAYMVVITLYTTIIITANDILPEWAIAIVIYSDPAVLGFFFLGGLMMLEKGENVRTALAMSAISPAQYLAAKSISLTIIALGAVIVLALCARLPLAGFPLVLFATATTSIMFICIGAIVALKFNTINGYLIGSVPIVTPLIAPAALNLFDPLPLFAFALPPTAQLKLLLMGFGVGSTSEATIAVCAVSCLAGAIGSFSLAQQVLKAELGDK